MPFNIPLLVLSLILVIYGLARRHRRSLPLPPGPRGWPFIGNLLDAPNRYQWIKYAELSRKHNTDILYLQVFQTPVIILNSVESVRELLIRRSSLTSSRPSATMLMELMGWGFILSFMPYGDRWRARRRVFWQEFNPANSMDHRDAQVKNARNFIKRLLDDPAGLYHHARYTPAATIIEVTYGMDVKFKDDPTIARSDHTLHYLNVAGIVGTFFVDYLPLLKYIPRWVPGASFRRFADRSCTDVQTMINAPYKEATRMIDQGKGSASFVSRSLAIKDNFAQSEDIEEVIKDAATVAYVGGADTTPSSLTTFFAAMVLHPNVQAKAQDELDLVLSSRLPTFEDLPSLPYIEAVMWETLRWKPVLPLGVVHMLVTEDIYKGYRLPAGSNIFCNVWELMRDESVFPDAATFNPDRFLKDGKINRELTDVVEMAFGFGRRRIRICPGRFLAMNTLLMWISSTLSVFNITKAKDDHGDDIFPETELLDGFITHLPHFQCSILPRSKAAEKLIRDADLL